jgi:hypothetical protein
LKYFQKIAEGLDVIPLLHATQRQQSLWNAHTVRTKHPGTAHSEVSDILLRFNDISEFEKTGDAASIVDDRETISFDAWNALPYARGIIFDLMRRVEGIRLGRVIITKLPPGKTITPHVDGGAPAEYYQRYQVALQSMPGAIFKIGDEQAAFRPGDVWWIDNRVEHSVINNSPDDRVVMIVDIRHG